MSSSEISMGSTAASGANDDGTAQDDFDNFLDQDITVIKRRGTMVKSDNVGAVFMQNIGAISEAVQDFQKMSDETFKNDAALYF